MSQGKEIMSKDTLVIIEILKHAGIERYDSKVVSQLLQFIYQYTTLILEEARVYSNHAQKMGIDIEDVKIATTLIAEKMFTSPPPREMLIKLAQEKNQIPLPEMKGHLGLRLPLPSFCLTNTNYRMRSKTPTTQLPLAFESNYFHLNWPSPFAAPQSNFFMKKSGGGSKKKKNQEAYNDLVRRAQLNLAMQNQAKLNPDYQYACPSTSKEEARPLPLISPEEIQYQNIHFQFKRKFTEEDQE